MKKFDLSLKEETISEIKKEAEIQSRSVSAMARIIIEKGIELIINNRSNNKKS